MFQIGHVMLQYRTPKTAKTKQTKHQGIKN